MVPLGFTWFREKNEESFLQDRWFHVGGKVVPSTETSKSDGSVQATDGFRKIEMDNWVVPCKEIRENEGSPYGNARLFLFRGSTLHSRIAFV